MSEPVGYLQPSALRYSGLAALLDREHHQLQRLGWKLLQTCRYAESDEAHAQVLLKLAAFPRGASVLDIGCGLGECARLMHQVRTDLRFTLVNFSAEQLKDCPRQFVLQLADAHSLPYKDASFDAVMFHYALGHMDWPIALAEAARVLRPGGVMLIHEIERVAGDNALMHRNCAYHAFDRCAVENIAARIGMQDVEHSVPVVVREFLREQWPSQAAISYEDLFAGTRPAVWRLTKRAD